MKLIQCKSVYVVALLSFLCIRGETPEFQAGSSENLAEKLIRSLEDISEKLLDDDQHIGESRSIKSEDIDQLESLLGALAFGQAEATGRSAGSFSTEHHNAEEELDTRNLTKKQVDEIKREIRQAMFSPEFQDRQGGSRPRPSFRLRPFGFLTRQRARQQLQQPQPSDFLRPPAGNNRPAPIGNAVLNGPVFPPNVPLQIPQSSAPVPGFATNLPNDVRIPPANNFQVPVNNVRQPGTFQFPPNQVPPRQQQFAPPPPSFPQQQQPQQQQQQNVRTPQFIPSLPESPDNFRPVFNAGNPAGTVRNVQQPILSAPLQNFGNLNLGNNFDVTGGAPNNALNPGNIVNRPNNPPLNNNGFANNNNNAVRNNVNCEKFTDEICLTVRNYPGDAILNALTRNKPVVDAMLAEARSQSADDLIDGVTAADERKYTYTHYFGNRRQGDDNHSHRDFASDGGFLCPSDVRYGKPQLAQNNRGVWKYVVNVGEYTQTLRMERCLKPDSSCSYVSPHYKSHCTQLYNYHRLLSWEQQRGLHVDIYKIPTACTCHIQGYAYLYPPLDGRTHGVLPPAFNTDNNTIPANRRADSGRQSSVVEPSFKPSRPVPAQSPEFENFLKDHAGGNSFLNDWNRRQDVLEDVPEVPVVKKDERKVNYSYHPITAYFLPKPQNPFQGNRLQN